MSDVLINPACAAREATECRGGQRSERAADRSFRLTQSPGWVDIRNAGVWDTRIWPRLGGQHRGGWAPIGWRNIFIMGHVLRRSRRSRIDDAARPVGWPVRTIYAGGHGG